MKIKSKGLAMLFVLSLVLSLCGCEKQNDSIKNDMQSLEGTDASVSGEAVKEKSSRLKEQLHIPEELQIDVLSDDGKRGYQVNCKVDVPIETSPAIYQQKQIPFTSEEVIKRAEKLFDSGEFTYVKPLDCYTLNELNEEYESLVKMREKKDAKDKFYYWLRSLDVETYMRKSRKEEVKDFKKGDFTEGADAAFYERIMIMEGEIAGEAYYLLAFTSGGHNYVKLCRRNQGYRVCEPESYFGYSFDTYDFDDDTSQGTSTDTNNIDDSEEAHIFRSLIGEFEPTQTVRKQYGENICSYSENEAGKLALQYAAMLGDTDMAIVKTNWNFWTPPIYLIPGDNEEYTYLPNGYTFYLQRQYGNLSCNESNFWWRESTDTNEETAGKADPLGVVAEQECYRVEVTDEGVISVDTIEPWYEIEKTLSESTSLMDFHDIEELAKGYFEEVVQGMKTDKYSEKNITRIGEVALRYATVLYDGEYTLIPCWFFNQSNGTIMVINAIDGSKVYLQRMY